MYGSDYHYDNESTAAPSQHQSAAAAPTDNSAASSHFSNPLSLHSPQLGTSAVVGVKQEEPNTSTPTAAPASALGASSVIKTAEEATRSNSSGGYYSDLRPGEQEQGGHIKVGSIDDLYKATQSPTIMQQQQNSPVSYNTGSAGAPPAGWQAAAGSAAGGAGQPAGGAGAPQTSSQPTPQPQPQGQQPGQQQSQQQQQQPPPTSSAQQQQQGAPQSQPQAQSQQQPAPTASQAQQPQQQVQQHQQPQHHTPVGQQQHPGVPHSSHAPHPYPFFYPTHPYASYPTEEGNYYDQSTNPNATSQPQQQIQPTSGQDWMQDNNQGAMYGHMPYPYPPMGSHQWSGQMRYGDMSANAAAAAAAANGPTPQLVRTTALSQAATSLGSNAVGVHGHGTGLQAQQHDAMISNPQFRASLELISGQLESLSSNWTAEEWHAKRRLVQFTRSQRGAVISAEFFPLEQSKYTANTPCISCIHWAERNECYVTSVDCIYLLEQLVNTKFSVEEKNRIRRNLEGYHPLTVSKGKAESGSFFRLIMSFSAPKPRNIEKDVKVFQWKILPHALKKIISKYSADYGHTAAATASLTAPPVPPPMAQPMYLPPTMGAQPQQPPPPQQQQQQLQQPGQQRQGTPQQPLSQSPGVPPSNNAFGAYR